MEIKPVVTKKPPEYPTEYLFINNPELFKRYIPLRWYKNKLVCTALSVFIVAGGTDSFSQSQQPTTEIIEQNGTNKPVKETKNDSVKVAPIFVHGDGSGSIGCIVTSPPVFISEREAMEIIMQELSKENIIIDTINSPVLEFKAQRKQDYQESYYGKHYPSNMNIKIDGINEKYNLAIEYLSAEEYDIYYFEDVRSTTAPGFDTKKGAKKLRVELEKNKKYNSVVFYDPMLNVDDDSDNQIRTIKKYKLYIKEYEKLREETKLKSKQLLVAQVQDFINWLKTEGILK